MVMKKLSIALFALFISFQVNAFDRVKAVQYIDLWWNSDLDNDGIHENINYPYGQYYDSGGDCANFGSQVLIAGGLKFGTEGSGAGGTITLAENLRNYLKSKYQSIESPNIFSEISESDIIFWTNHDSLPDADHTMEVRTRVAEQVATASHDNDRNGLNLSGDNPYNFLPVGAQLAFLHIYDSPVVKQVLISQVERIKYHGYLKSSDNTLITEVCEPVNVGEITIIIKFDCQMETNIGESDICFSINDSEIVHRFSDIVWEDAFTLSAKYDIPKNMYSEYDGENVIKIVAKGNDHSMTDIDCNLTEYTPGPNTMHKFIIATKDTDDDGDPDYSDADDDNDGIPDEKDPFAWSVNDSNNNGVDDAFDAEIESRKPIYVRLRGGGVSSSRTYGDGSYAGASYPVTAWGQQASGGGLNSGTCDMPMSVNSGISLTASCIGGYTGSVSASFGNGKGKWMGKDMPVLGSIGVGAAAFQGNVCVWTGSAGITYKTREADYKQGDDVNIECSGSGSLDIAGGLLASGIDPETITSVSYTASVGASGWEGECFGSASGLMIAEYFPSNTAEVANNFSAPSSIASGSLLVADTGNSKIQVFTSTGGYLRDIGTGILNNPLGVCEDSLGRIYAGDGSASIVRVFNADGNILRTDRS